MPAPQPCQIVHAGAAACAVAPRPALSTPIFVGELDDGLHALRAAERREEARETPQHSGSAMTLAGNEDATVKARTHAMAMHAEWLDVPRLGMSIGAWLVNDDEQLRHVAAEFFRFVDRVGDRLAYERRRLFEGLIDAAPRLNKRYHAHR